MNKEEEDKLVQEATWGRNVETKAEKKERKKKNRNEVVKNLKENAKKFGEGLNKLAEGLAPKEETDEKGNKKDKSKKVDIYNELFGETELTKGMIGNDAMKFDLGF